MLTSTVLPASDLIEAVLDGEPDVAGVAALRARVARTVEEQGGVRLLAEVRDYADPQSSQVQQDLRALAAAPGLRRWALVASSARFRASAERLLAFAPVEGRVFEYRDDAAEWLRS